MKDKVCVITGGTDGIGEATFAVNHLAPFLLTNLLLETLKRGTASRVVTTASNAHRSAKLAFDDLQMTSKYSPMGAYGVSKLANISARRDCRRMNGRNLIRA